MNLKQTITALIPRIFSSLDTNPLSPTYGCFDKAYWWYKTKDFPCARVQEAVLALGLLYTKDASYHTPSIKALIEAALHFTLKIQHANGSFDEWYPREQSYCATAFVTYALSETLILLKKDISPLLQKKVISHLEKSYSFFLNQHEDIANQVAGSLAALYNLFLLTQKTQYKQAAEKKLLILQSLFHVEGWFREYCGADLGYQTITLEFLADYAAKSKDKKAHVLLNKGGKFLAHFVPLFGGIYGSRNTRLCFPYGLLQCAKITKNTEILPLVQQEIKNPFLQSMDERYALIYCISYVKIMSEKIPQEKTTVTTGWHIFPAAGLAVYCDKKKCLVVNGSKGGVFECSQPRYTDSGIFLKKGKKIFSSQWLHTSRFTLRGQELICKGKLVRIPRQTTLSSLSLFASRLFAPWVKKITRAYLIIQAPKSLYSFTRVITPLSEGIKVVDILENKKRHALQIFYGNGEIQTQYVPTARFYHEPIRPFHQKRKSRKKRITLTRFL